MIPFFEIPKIRRRQLAIQRMKLKNQARRMASFRTPITQPQVIEQEETSLPADYQAIIKAIDKIFTSLGGYAGDDYTTAEGMMELAQHEENLAYDFVEFPPSVEERNWMDILLTSNKMKSLYESADMDNITRSYLGIKAESSLVERLNKYIYYKYDFADSLSTTPEKANIELSIQNPYDPYDDESWQKTKRATTQSEFFGKYIGYNEYSIPMRISSSFSEETSTGLLEEVQLAAFLEGLQMFFNYYVDGRSQLFPVRIEWENPAYLSSDRLNHTYSFRARFRVYKS